MKTKTLFLMLLSSFSTVIITNGLAFAEPITGCVKKFTGIISKVQVGTEPSRPCRFFEQEITWDQEGPPGQDGADGANGSDGLNGALTGKGTNEGHTDTAIGEIYKVVNNEIRDDLEQSADELTQVHQATCNSPADIAVSGSCDIEVIQGTFWVMKSSGISGNASSSIVSEQSCSWKTQVGLGLTTTILDLTAVVHCIRVE